MRLNSLVVLLSVTPLIALGQEGGGQDWSMSTGRTVGHGENAVGAEIGWPGIEGKYLHGLSDRFDVGARFAFLYGTTVGVDVAPAFTFGALMRAGLVRNGMVSLGLEFNPGVGFGFDHNGDGGSFLVHFPLELQVGVHPASIVNVVFGVRMTPTIVVPFQQGVGVGFAMPILFGPGVELFLARNLMVTLQTRFGPGVWARGSQSQVLFSFVANFGIGYHF